MRCAQSEDRRPLPDRAHDPGDGLRTQELVTLVGLAAASRSASRRIVGVEAKGINACPCAQGLVRDQAAERLGEAGFEDADVARILELVQLQAAQPARPRRLPRHRPPARRGGPRRAGRELYELARLRAPEAPGRAVRRRARPLAALRRGLGAPVKGALEATAPSRTRTSSSPARSIETIHNHDVLAERFGTVGELRGELANGGHSARHTELGLTALLSSSVQVPAGYLD